MAVALPPPPCHTLPPLSLGRPSRTRPEGPASPMGFLLWFLFKFELSVASNCTSLQTGEHKCANNLRCLFMNRGAFFMVQRIMVQPPYWFNCLPVPSCNTYFVRIMVNPLDTTAEPLFLCIYMVSTDKKKRHITMGKKVAPNFVRHWQKPPVKNGLAFQTNKKPYTLETGYIWKPDIRIIRL